jgi:murein biosynthesis integral membrane protein MurJ
MPNGAPGAEPGGTGGGGGQLIRNTGVTSVAAGAGVIAGLLLDVSIAAKFGAGSTTDAFFVAARLPIGIASVLMAGANQALVPAVSTWLVRKGNKDTSRLVSLLLTATLLAGFALVAVVGVVAWPLMRITAPGLKVASINQAADLARIMFLIVPLVGAAEVLRAFLNAKHSFGPPAAMNVVMNGGAALLIFTVSHHSMTRVAWAYVIGAAAQLVFMVMMSYRVGLRYHLGFGFRDPDLTAAIRLTGRPLAAAGLNPLARVVEQLFVSYLPAGSITILNYAIRLVNAIGGTVFFRSVMVVLLPRLTKAHALDDQQATRRLTDQGIKIMLALSIPLTAFMAILAKPAALVVFHRGRFSRNDAAMLGLVLAVYSLNLVGAALQRALLAPFFGRLDMKTPWRNSVYGVVANLVLLPIFVLPFPKGDSKAMYGVALAFSLAQYVNVAHAWYRLREIVPKPMSGAWMTTVRLTVASAIAAVNMLLAMRLLNVDGFRLSRFSLLLRTGAVGLIGFAVLSLALLAFGGPDADRVLDALLHPRRRSEIAIR